VPQFLSVELKKSHLCTKLLWWNSTCLGYGLHLLESFLGIAAEDDRKAATDLTVRIGFEPIISFSVL
jgi:hypothetical protein